MTLTFSMLTIAYIVSACVSAASAAFAWSRRRATGGLFLFLMMSAGLQWAVADALEISARTLEAHIFWSKVSYIGSTSIGVFLLLFTIEYTGGRRFLTPGFVSVLFVPPVLSVLGAFVNEALPLTWTAVTWAAEGNNIVIYHHGPFYWAITIYILVVSSCASVILVRFAARTRSVYRFQSVAIITGVAVTWGAAIAYDIHPGIFAGLDANVTFTFSGALLTYAMLRHGLLDLVPVARGALVEEMADGVLVLDARSRIVDANPSAAILLSAKQSVLIGETVDVALADLPEIETAIRRATSADERDLTTVVVSGRHVDIQVTPVHVTARGPSGRLVVLRDVSNYKRIERHLQVVNTDLESRMAEVVELQAELQEAAIRDSLTGLYNRRYMAETLDREFHRARREGYPISVAMVDVDNFKDVNDEHGHAMGDSLLVNLGVLLRSRIRGGDIAFRYGGDEFVVVLPNTRPADAVGRAEGWRAEFASSAPKWLGRRCDSPSR